MSVLKLNKGKEMKLFNVKQQETTGKWMICEGLENNTCAGYWATKEEADGVAELLNDCAE